MLLERNKEINRAGLSDEFGRRRGSGSAGQSKMTTLIPLPFSLSPSLSLTLPITHCLILNLMMEQPFPTHHRPTLTSTPTHRLSSTHSELPIRQPRDRSRQHSPLRTPCSSRTHRNRTRKKTTRLPFILVRTVPRHPQSQSWLLRVPPEIFVYMLLFVRDPLDLLSLSHTCALLHVFWTNRDWYQLWQTLYPDWTKGFKYEHVLLPGKADAFRDWQRVVTRDACLRRKLLSPLVLPPSVGDASLDVTPLLKGQTRPALRISLHHAQYYPADPATANSNWRRVGSPIYHLNKTTHTTLAASMMARTGQDTITENRILLYNLPDLTNPLAVCTSEYWTQDIAPNQPWHHPFRRQDLQVTQLIDVKHFPETVIENKMRVLIVLAFGENAGPLTQDGNDLNILDVWLMVKIVEAFIPVKTPAAEAAEAAAAMQGPLESSTASASPIVSITEETPSDNDLDSDPDTDSDMDIVSAPSLELLSAVPPTQNVSRPGRIRIETIMPSAQQNIMRGRMAKIYQAKDPKTGLEVDCIALFGIQHTDDAPAIVAKKVLFQNGARGNSWSKKAIGSGVSCMTLFPAHSQYERILALFNCHGEGVLFDWVNDKPIAKLEKPASSQASRMYYWGVQVNWAIETPDVYSRNRDQRRVFRVVALADGSDSEWESTWWNVDSTVLGPCRPDLEMPTFIPPGHPRPPSVVLSDHSPTEIKPSKTRCQKLTTGVTVGHHGPEEDPEAGKPQLYIAFVVFNRYRILLTTRLGISIVDMEEEGPGGEVPDLQWVTFLGEDDPLVDMATCGESLVLTRRHSHVVVHLHGNSWSI